MHWNLFLDKSLAWDSNANGEDNVDSRDCDIFADCNKRLDSDNDDPMRWSNDSCKKILSLSPTPQNQPFPSPPDLRLLQPIKEEGR